MRFKINKIGIFFSKLNIRIASAFLLFSTIIIFIFTMLSYSLTSDILKSEDSQKTKESITLVADYIHSYLNKLKSFSDIIAMHPDIKNALNDTDAGSLDSIASLIRLAKESDPRIKSISVVSKNGHVITSSKDMAVPITEDMMDEEWYKKALDSSSMPILTPTGHGVFEMDNGDWIVSICREITSDENIHLGIILIDVSYKFIEDYINGLSLGKEGYVYILSEEGSIIYHPDKSVLTNMSLPNTDKENGMIYNVPIPDSDWMMYGVGSGENLLILQARLLRTLFIAILITIILVMMISGIISQILSNPIIKLTQIMMNADKTWEHIGVEKNASFEVNSLAKEYNHLIDRIKLLTENIAKKESDRREFELRALQSQINPHFLYNTLDTILWLAELGQTEEVVNVTSSLGKMLRISLKTGKDFIPLEIELAHTISYLNIQKVRYDDLLQYEISGDETLNDYYIPKLIIQPLVENSIYHGIRGKKDKGHIKIHYYKDNTYLFIEISDDGVGFDIIGVDSNREKEANISGGIGMNNVLSRIQILCGREYGFKIYSIINKGTQIIIKLPLLEYNIS